MKKSFEVRLHGRGGQGGVTCAKILAAVYAHLGHSVQTFGDYASERSGAPVRAYTRVGNEPITNRNKVYEPDEVLVLDDSLLGADTLDGLVDGGALLVNSPLSIEVFDQKYSTSTAPFTTGVIDATAIARKHGIGTRSVVIVNTTIAGAYARIHDVPLEALKQTYTDLGLISNFPAALEAYESVEYRGPVDGAHVEKHMATQVTLPEVEQIIDHVSSSGTGLATGSWSSQKPSYVENLAPCNAWCPAGNDVVGFIGALETSEQAAAEILGQSTPLAAVCGRVCPAPCMEACNRAEYDGAVNIRGLERWIADTIPVAVKKVARVSNAKRIAIIGGGPAGLAAAYEIAKAGHAASIYEGEKELGGVLRTGIPVYRLARPALDQEIENILALGVEAHCDEFLTANRMAEIEAEYDAVIIASGLQKLRGLEVDGAQLAGIEQGIQYLHRVNLPEDGKSPVESAAIQGHVVVLGGGNTAMDCARSALRAGANKVTVAYRRSFDEMPAIKEEIEEAGREGIVFAMLRQPVGFSGTDNLSGVVLAEVDLGEPDDSGRRRPITSTRTAVMDCDAVLLALGQTEDYGLLPEGWELPWGSERRVTAGNRGEILVFGAGDIATGEGTVTHAIGSGRRAAGLALAALSAVDVNDVPLDETHIFQRPDRTTAIPVTDIRLDHFARAQADTEQTIDPMQAVKNFNQVNNGLRSKQELHRCFSCGHCTECDTCLVYCPEGIIRRLTDEGTPYEVDYSYCKGCGICVEECPRSAMEMSS
ncbi:MAG: 2-oxoacid:acceptor oxidoreductase family protein [Proteobacteria bacterium]|nr:2-oxoacid:acceptor oxidoreductase family protein [Pseudomonadota bacterium]